MRKVEKGFRAFEKERTTDNMTKQEILEQIRGGLIVSCQALEHEPLYTKEGGIMPLMAKAAAQSGAVGIRANTVRDITQIKEVVDASHADLAKNKE